MRFNENTCKQLFCILVISQTQTISCDMDVDRNVIGAVGDFFKIQRAPSKVTSFLCWRKNHVINLEKSLSSENIYYSENYDSAVFTRQLPRFWPGEHQFYLLDLNCEHAEDILDIANRDELLKSPYRWMILENCQGVQDFQKYDIPLNSRIYTLDTC